ncbi:MAG TPA: leucine-rich repeat domain-containing protein [Clostridia bacterium]|nr:leucine-rich repeat domain-containing protein [Clostridia bacterium]HQM39100.1 leucine-rich repeat domain-containing protein [Clostridia bacterium]
MKNTKRNRIVLLLLVVLLLLSSCDKNIETSSPEISTEIVASPTVTPTEEPASPTVSPIIVPTPTPTPVPTSTPTLTPTPTPIPEKPETFTPEKYFTFDAMHGIILDYDIEGGRYVSIPNSIDGVEVVKIGEDAFRGKDLYGVIVPDTVRIIEKSAFEWCFLRELTLGNNIVTINDNAFYNCYIDNLVLPSNVKYIGDSAFANSYLTSIVISDSVTYIGDSAFSGHHLTSIVIPDSVTYIGDSAFSGNNLESIVVSDSVTYIGRSAFGRIAEDKITLGKGVTSFWVIEGNILLGHIGKPAPNLLIPSFTGVDTIGKDALSWCDLKSVTIPDNISIIERNAFANNKGLNITIPSSVISINMDCFPEDAVINCKTGSYAEYYAKGRSLTCVINGSVDSTYFPVERNEIINANISVISKQDFQYPLVNWIRKYLSNKYYSNEITYIGISTNIYEDSKYYIYDKTDSSMLDGYTVKTKQYYVVLSANKDISGITRSTSGYYGFYIQVIVFYNEDGTVILSGFLQGDENMLDTRTDLYNYVVADNRFTFNEYTEAGSILNSTEKAKIINVSDYSIITELIKGVDYAKDSYREEYVPLNKDVVAFFVPGSVSTVYIVDLSNNNIIFSKKYTRWAYLSAHDGICTIKYHIDSDTYYDTVNAHGQIIEEKVAAENFYDVTTDIPDTSYKIVQDDGTVSLYNTTTGVNNILLKEKLRTGAFWGKYYFFKEILDINRFIYTCFVSNGYVPSNFYTYIYDIRDGSSIELYGADINILYTGHYRDKYFAIYDSYYNDTLKIYTITTEGIDEGKLTCITDNVDMCNAIKDFSFTEDGKYLLMLTSVYASKEEDGYAGSEYIVILDTETKKVLYQDELILENGKITHFLDDTFCVSDSKTLIYIDFNK